jgi:hypothetical protein
MPLKAKRTTSGAVTRILKPIASKKENVVEKENIVERTDIATPSRIALAQCTPDPFEDGDLRSYLEKFSLVAEANGWPDNITCKRLPLFLKGRASTLYRQIPSSGGLLWDEICEKFMNLFHPPEERLIWLKKFHERIARPMEPLEVVAEDLKRHLTFAMPSIPINQLDLLLKFQLLRSLPANLVEKLEIHQHIMTFDQLVAKARLAITETGSTPAVSLIGKNIHQSNLMETKADTVLDERLAVLEAEIQRIHLKQRSNGPCFNCGRVGHLAKECRGRPSTQFNNNNRQNLRYQGNGMGPRRAL